MRSVAKSLWLLVFAVILVCGIYPGVLWVIGQSLWPFQANGSIVVGPDGKPVGSLLVAQPFTRTNTSSRAHLPRLLMAPHRARRRWQFQTTLCAIA